MDTEQSYEKALEWFTKSAEQGNVLAQSELGLFYFTGLGVEKDKEKAVYWWSKAAEQGNTASQLKLSYCYSNGYGVEKDLKIANLLLKAGHGAISIEKVMEIIKEEKQ